MSPIEAVYLERNQVVAGLAALALRLGYRAGVAQTIIEGWDPEWHGAVYIDLPTGQVSWHFHRDHAWLYSFLPPYPGQWDGHNTAEKYRRVLALPAENANEHSTCAGAVERQQSSQGTRLQTGQRAEGWSRR